MNPISLDIYNHYKGNQYEVIGIAKHSETLEDVVIYKALYADGGIWVRPLSMWENLIQADGKTMRRFEYVGTNKDPCEQCNLSGALRSIESTIDKCEKALAKLVDGTSQHTLTKRRI